VLTDAELLWFWQACQDIGYPFGPLAMLLLLTGQRRNEVAGMAWAELDIEKREWRIPGQRTKNGEPHIVPLSEAALTIIEGLPNIKNDKGYLFTTTCETSVSGFSRAKAAIDSVMRVKAGDAAIDRWTFHDLRRTAASGMARLGTVLPVIEKVLNHSSGSFAGIVGIYQRHSFADEKRNALEAWAKFVVSLAESRSTNVLPLRA
jgi:integrase